MRKTNVERHTRKTKKGRTEVRRHKRRLLNQGSSGILNQTQNEDNIGETELLTKIYSNDWNAIELLQEIDVISDDYISQIIDFLENQNGLISEAKFAAGILEYLPDKINNRQSARKLFDLLSKWGQNLNNVPAGEYDLYRESIVGCLYLADLWSFSIPPKVFGNMREWNDNDYSFDCFKILRKRKSSQNSFSKKNYVKSVTSEQQMTSPSISDLETIKRLSDKILSEIEDLEMYTKLLETEKDLLYSCLGMHIKILLKFMKYPSPLTSAYKNYIELNNKKTNLIEKKVFHPYLLQLYDNVMYEEHKKDGEPDFLFDGKIPIEAKYDNKLSIKSHIRQLSRYTNLFGIILMPWLIKHPERMNMSIDSCIGIENFKTDSGEERIVIYLTFFL